MHVITRRVYPPTRSGTASIGNFKYVWLVFLGLSAAFGGPWVERRGPREPGAQQRAGLSGARGSNAAPSPHVESDQGNVPPALYDVVDVTAEDIGHLPVSGAPWARRSEVLGCGGRRLNRNGVREQVERAGSGTHFARGDPEVSSGGRQAAVGVSRPASI